MHRDRPAAAERPNTAGCRTSPAGTSSARSSSWKLLGIVDQRQQVGERDELAVVQPAADEAGVAVAALLAVGDHVDVCAQLRVHAQPHGVVGGGLELVLRQPAFQMVMHRLHHPARPWPAAHAHHGQRRNRRSGGGLGQALTEASRFDGIERRSHRLDALRWRGARAFSQSALAHQERRGLATGAGHRHQLVARETAPGGQILLDGDLGGDDLQQAAARKRIDVTADHQQQAAAAVEIAPVEAGVRKEGVKRGRVHLQ